MHCTACGSTELDQGFILTETGRSHGLGRWVSGVYTSALFGTAPKGMNKRLKGQVVSFRCRKCSHLEQFVAIQGPRPLAS
jgi:hypothetical protein